MAYRVDKESNGDSAIVISGWETGIARSPLSGIANMQAVNINTENKEVMVSYERVQQTTTNQTANGTLSPLNSTTLENTGLVTSLKAGLWINVSASTITGLSTGNYYVAFVDSAIQIKLSQFYGGATLTGLGATGTATYSILRNVGKPIASATERYFQSGEKYRYYILDSQGLVWVYDTGTADPTRGLTWFLPDSSITYFGSSTAPSGIFVLNGWLHVIAGDKIFVKPTVNLASSTSTSTNWVAFAPGELQGLPSNINLHYAFVGSQGKAYYTDGNYVGSIFPNSSLLSGATNIQTYASYTASTTTGTISNLLSGSTPTSGGTTPRIPVIFFTALTASAALPTAITANTVYYIEYSKGADTFQVFAALTGGAALDIQTGAVGTQYFNTYYPGAAGGSTAIVFTPLALILPTDEIATSITEIGNTVIVGGRKNVLYPWNQVDPTPADLIFLPENNTVKLITVNNMAYATVGNKGNIYVTNGSTASLALTVPDYCAGIAGSKNSYIEPFFVWGDIAYIRGRVYFSIQDQTSAKTGNCGGIWSFVPTQNFFYGQDTGMALRVEHRNSYGTYNGAASVLLPSFDQASKGAQFWSGWYSSITSPLHGIDFSQQTTATSSATLGTPAVIETDLIPTGTFLNKRTFHTIEYKLSAPLTDGETISIAWRQNGTDSFASAGTATTEGTTGLSGYFNVNFQSGQWLQLRITLTPNSVTTDTNASFVRLTEVRARYL